MPIFEVTFFGLTLAPTWYGFMYAIGFTICYLFMKRWRILSISDLDSLLIFVFFGVILGGRLGYVIFYDFSYFFENPEDIWKIWQGGMSFHGGAIGVILALSLFSRWKHIALFPLSDRLVLILPIALGLGRIGNWINGELPGFTPYSGPFPLMIDGVAHFPSPLFQAFLEGIVLFLIIQILSKTRWGRLGKGRLSAAFLIGYGMLRIFAELFRLPDEKIGYIFSTDWMTLGMLYSVPMILLGIFILSFSSPTSSPQRG